MYFCPLIVMLAVYIGHFVPAVFFFVSLRPLPGGVAGSG